MFPSSYYYYYYYFVLITVSLFNSLIILFYCFPLFLSRGTLYFKRSKPDTCKNCPLHALNNFFSICISFLLRVRFCTKLLATVYFQVIFYYFIALICFDFLAVLFIIDCILILFNSTINISVNK